MNKSLHYIHQKSRDIQIGLLRLHEKNGTKTWHVKLTPDSDESLNCIFTTEETARKLRNKNINLVQKKHDDYLYISGIVTDEAVNGARILSIRILKACWYEKKTNGNLSWLKEKYIYESEEIKKAIA